MKLTSIGVVVGRFQAPALHEGHKYLIDLVSSMHEQVLIVLGSRRGFATKSDPLDYASRKVMIFREFPAARIAELLDEKMDEMWSKSLDMLIRREFPDQEAVLYGSRGSFIPHYSGRFACATVESKNEALSSTEVREEIYADPPSTEDFRAGMIYAQKLRFPMSYQAVDIAVVDFGRKRVLLGGRKNEPGVRRFIGGFVDKTDESLEFAAKREVFEEASGMEVDNLHYLGSCRIDDWRYRGTEDGIMTAFFAADYIFGAAKAGDDMDSLEWVPFSEFEKNIVAAHKPLAEKLRAHLKERI